MNVGTVIRKHRKNKKLTLRVVAEEAGISEGFLSQIENNVNSPSVDTLIKICNAIGINAGDVLNQVENQEKIIVVHKKDWNEIEISHTGFATRHFFSPENRSDIDSAILVLEPEKSIPVRKGIKNSQEILSVLSGKIKLIHGEEEIILSEGDTVHYLTNPEKQMITNINKNRSIVLWAGTL